MNKEDLIDFLKDNLRIRINKDLHTQYNDYEYSEKLEVSLVLMDGYEEIEIDSDFIPMSALLK